MNSGEEEEVIDDNDGDDEADELGLGRKRKRLLRNNPAAAGKIFITNVSIQLLIKTYLYY